MTSRTWSSEDSTYVGGPNEGPNKGGLYPYSHYHASDITPAHVAAWLLFAARRVKGRFTLAVPTLPKQRRYPPEDDDDGDEEEEPAAGEVEGLAVAVEEMEAMEEEEEESVLFAELPCSARMKEMSLTLGKAILTVPTAGAGAFHALTDFLLSHVRLDAGGGDDLRLGHLLSRSCSPRLRKVHLGYIFGLSTLRLDAASTLAELRLLGLHQLRTLDVAAPGLRVLAVEDGSYMVAAARIAAPRLEVLGCGHIGPAERLQFDGAASLRRIDHLTVWSHRLPRDQHDLLDNSAALWFLRHCSGVGRLSVDLALCMWPLENISGEEEMADYDRGHADSNTTSLEHSAP
ncbi:hypothetical protein C2845_PM05G16420 [Panicum miliaceum]|uniref:Uncharacterized protein n=1 Tax=Panicum miliaceum TaxID=4540 RepID=A0A3L6T2Y9_PANMI|nr:hypothetical protein C2845_PM05G16420 [Panicum miliaceum]